MLSFLQAQQGKHFTGDMTKVSALQEMMRLVSRIPSMDRWLDILTLWAYDGPVC